MERVNATRVRPGRGSLRAFTRWRPSGGGRLRLVFLAPTRGLIGYLGELLTDTRGTAIMNRLFHNWGAYKGEIAGRRNGVLISNDAGEAVAYAMWNLEDRGPMMIEPGLKKACSQAVRSAQRPHPAGRGRGCKGKLKTATPGPRRSCP